jgi:hypothetical protein
VRAAVADGHQARVFNLLVAPEHAQRFAFARKQLLGQQAHAVHVEQRAVGVKQHGAQRSRVVARIFSMASTLFDTA